MNLSVFKLNLKKLYLYYAKSIRITLKMASKINKSTKTMIHSFLNDLDTFFIVIVLFFSMLAAVWIGYKIGLSKTKTDNKNSEISSSLLGLLALILGLLLQWPALATRIEKTI